MKSLRLLSLLTLALTLNLSVWAQKVTVTILHNNDGESQLINAGSGVEEFGGAARFIAKKNELATTATGNGEIVLTLSSGDNFLAGPEFNAGLNRPAGKPMFDSEVLAAIDYDAICLGNHDYDFGPEVLARLINEVNAIKATPFLSANSDFSGEPSLSPLKSNGKIASGTILTRGGIKIGIVGATTPQLKNISSPGGVIVKEDVAKEVQAIVDDYKNNQGVELVILISHLQGLTEDLALIPMLSNVDVVIAGGGDELLGDNTVPVVPSDTAGGNTFYGTYPLMPKDKDGNTVYTVTTPGEYKYVGKLTFEFDTQTEKVTSVDNSSKIVRVASKAHADGVNEDPILKAAVVDLVSTYLNNLANNIIANKDVDLDGTRDNIRNNETNLGNLVADAMRWQADELSGTFGTPKATIGVQNGGGIRNNTIIGGSELSELHTFDILPFSNFVTLVEDVTPAILKELLENFVSVTRGGTNDGSGRFGQISGFSFVYDTAATSLEYDLDGKIVTQGQRIWEVKLDDGTLIVDKGQVVNGAPNVTLAIADFSAKGGDQYPLGDLKRTQLGATYQQALFNYITSSKGLNGNISASDYPEGGEGRITFKTTASIEKKNLTQAVKIYPNPTQGKVNVILNEEGNAQVIVYDLMGKLILKQSTSSVSTVLDLSSLQAGMYVITTDQNGVSSRQFILVK